MVAFEPPVLLRPLKFNPFIVSNWGGMEWGDFRC